MIKANSEADTAQMQDLEEQVEAYEAVLQEMRKLRSLGAKNVMVSSGGRGAALLAETGAYFSCTVPKVPEGRPFNTVAAGDSMIAGFIHEYQKSQDYINFFFRKIQTRAVTRMPITTRITSHIQRKPSKGNFTFIP